MQQILLNVKDQNEVNFVLELLRKFDFVEILKTAPPTDLNVKKKQTKAQQEFAQELREALHEVELHQQGKIKLRSAWELLNEL